MVDWSFLAFVVTVVFIAVPMWLMWASDYYKLLTRPAARNRWGLSKLAPRRFPRRTSRPGPPLAEMPVNPLVMPWELEDDGMGEP